MSKREGKDNAMVFYRDWFETAMALPNDKLRSDFFASIIAYGLHVDYDTPKELEVALMMARTRIDRDKQHRAEVCEKNRLNGKKGGLAKVEHRRQETYQSLPIATIATNLANDSETYQDEEVEKEVEEENIKENLIKESGENIPPTLEDVRLYIADNNITNVNPDTFFNYYNAKGWIMGKAKMKNWHSAIEVWRTSNNNDVTSRCYSNGNVGKKDRDRLFAEHIAQELNNSSQEEDNDDVPF